MFKKILKAVAASVLLLGVVAAPSAVAANADSARASASTPVYAPLPLPANSVGEKQIAPNSGSYLDWGSALRGEWTSMKSRISVAENKADDALARPDLGRLYTTKVFDPTVITNIGGKFLERNTPLGSIDLPAGDYTLVLDAKFTRVAEAADAAPPVRPQAVARMNQTATEFGKDFGTIMGNDIAPFNGADLTGSDVTYYPLATPQTITFALFGQNDKRSDVGSGQISAQVTVRVYAS